MSSSVCGALLREYFSNERRKYIRIKSCHLNVNIERLSFVLSTNLPDAVFKAELGKNLWYGSLSYPRVGAAGVIVCLL